MITSVTVTNHLGSYATIELRNPEKSGFCILNMDGISTNQATVNITDIGTTDGSYFNSARISSRNITMEIKLLPMPTIEECRHTFYSLFQPKFPIRLTFHSDTRDCYVDGYVESAPVEIFTSWEKANVSIICPDPFFHDVNAVETVFSSITDEFEVPLFGADDYIPVYGLNQDNWQESGIGTSGHQFSLDLGCRVGVSPTPVASHWTYSNTSSGLWGQFKILVGSASDGLIVFDGNGKHDLESFKKWVRVYHPVIASPDTTQNGNIEFGSITYYTEKTIVYDGEDQIGVVITMHAIGSVGNITLYNANTRETMSISSDIIATMTGAGISSMDDIVINTSPGQKAVTLIRGGISTNILNALGRNSDWFMLANGDNKFTYTATSGGSNLIFSISHRNVYTGI